MTFFLKIYYLEMYFSLLYVGTQYAQKYEQQSSVQNAGIVFLSKDQTINFTSNYVRPVLCMCLSQGFMSSFTTNVSKKDQQIW